MRRYTSLWILALLLLLAACRTPAPTPDPNISGGGAPPPTLAAAPIQPSFSFSGVAFSYDRSLATAISGAATPSFARFDGSSSAPLPVLQGLPDFLEITLQTDSRPGRIGIQFIRDAAGEFYDAYDDAARVGFLTLEEDVSTRAGIGPLRDFSQLRYVAFGGGSGRRMIVVAEDEDPAALLSPERLYYVFEGTTADGRHAVHFRYPISALDFESLAAATTIPAELLLALNAAASSRFAPDLAQLDALVASLQVAPEERFNYAAAAGQEAAPTASLCQPIETVIFSCRLDGDGRLISVCASPDVSATTGYLVYYEGAEPAAVAFRFPELAAQSQQAFRYGESIAPERAFRSLSFAVGDTAYTLFDDYDAQGAGAARSAGVQLTSPDGAEQQLLCGEPATHNLLALAPLVAAGEWRAVSPLAAAAAAAPSAEEAPADPEPVVEETPAPLTTHLVLAGETLAAIGARYGVDWPLVAAANNIPPPYAIRAGDLLVIPDAPEALAPPAGEARATYVVQAGDTLQRIGLQTGIPWPEIAAENGLIPPYQIQAGQVLILPVDD